MSGVALPFTASHRLRQHDPARRRDAAPRQPGDRAPHQEPRSAGTRWRWSSAPTATSDGIGGHISTYASAATLYEVGFNHFFRGKGRDGDGDIIYFQGHASPGIYARAFLEGRLSSEQLDNFRHELRARRRPLVVSASLADARLLGIRN